MVKQYLTFICVTAVFHNPRSCFYVLRRADGAAAPRPALFLSQTRAEPIAEVHARGCIYSEGESWPFHGETAHACFLSYSEYL